MSDVLVTVFGIMYFKEKLSNVKFHWYCYRGKNLLEKNPCKEYINYYIIL